MQVFLKEKGKKTWYLFDKYVQIFYTVLYTVMAIDIIKHRYAWIATKEKGGYKASLMVGSKVYVLEDILFNSVESVTQALNMAEVHEITRDELQVLSDNV